jgi:hypothetical protein
MFKLKWRPLWGLIGPTTCERQSTDAVRCEDDIWIGLGIVVRLEYVGPIDGSTKNLFRKHSSMDRGTLSGGSDPSPRAARLGPG